MHEACLIIIHDHGMGLGPELNQGTFGLTAECSTTELTLIQIAFCGFSHTLPICRFFFFFFLNCFLFWVFKLGIAVLPSVPTLIM